MNHLGIKGKVALVTGAAQGIGEAIARAMAQYGAHVAAVDSNAERLDAVVNDILAEGGRAAAFRLDVRDGSSVEEIVERIEKEIGPIEILVHAAGILRTGPIASLSDEDWSSTFEVNCTGVFRLSRSVMNHMMPRMKGSIVTVGSNAAGVPRMQMSAYAASKAAVTMFTKCMGLELARYRIRCNIVSPGSTDTEMQRSLWKDEQGAEAIIAGHTDSYRLGIPLGKLAAASDIAEAVIFLASDLASHITMHDLCVDGGATLGI
ncbi:2,3-dihydro-2,3-dihydroxybenzoate dehydrogenase [Paenibacillus hemerocallicola]|uniref:2,3-dihydro-2,3-dihydroxybenzoate dehydrogenase n=1 Tax=Paenibacillus hemerocallicola TaxID=1172614 RepID=A0A5C4SYY2_9BACL|nr:2,3-dihydro-2,3-dihydroxybenzoate dehydrogenase [Paenibacillus hemerocallicola]TNJ61570.1 2,3-dihydro-2,3-dihydroxybenzoate dehydrogenase [Paenibacillus hemerocallicola]